MNSKQLKTKITKILKSNNFIKSEIRQDYGHPKCKHAGFDYNEFGTGLTYYIPNNVFTDEEKQKKVKEKVQQIYDVLVGNGLEEYLQKWDYSITFKKLY